MATLGWCGWITPGGADRRVGEECRRPQPGVALHLARSALIVVLAAASLGGLADRSVAATGTYQVTLTQTAGTLKPGTVETVTAMVLVAGGATAADGTLVGFSTTGDVAVPDVVGMAPHGADGYWLVDSAGHVL